MIRLAHPHCGTARLQMGALQKLIHSHSSIEFTTRHASTERMENVHKSNTQLTSCRRQVYVRAYSKAMGLTATIPPIVPSPNASRAPYIDIREIDN
jgi:hypothetical protein